MHCRYILYVVGSNTGSLLSFKTATELNLIKINTATIQAQPKAKKPKRKRKMFKVNQSLNTEQSFVSSPQNDLNKSEAQPSHIAEILIKYADCFEGLGKLKDYKVKLHVDRSVPPVAQPPPRIPFHLRKKVS